ncbi:hypothetical protein H0H92_006353 [Tricholoma furcatifolium]|nr:hypothetical protein H0H92_006353 [Tricholoma furcatifolium]
MADEPGQISSAQASIAPTPHHPRSLLDDASTAAHEQDIETKHEQDDSHDQIVAGKEEGSAAEAGKFSASASAAHANPDFPDGGWRAWLIVFGVRSLIVVSSFHAC